VLARKREATQNVLLVRKLKVPTPREECSLASIMTHFGPFIREKSARNGPFQIRLRLGNAGCARQPRNTRNARTRQADGNPSYDSSGSHVGRS
jgi:hypothetical protein